MSKKKPYEISLLTEWMNRLGLQEWSIVLETGCAPGDMAIPGAMGCTSWEESTKTAAIQIVDPERLDRRRLVRDFDFEEVLIHELLHLKTCLLASTNEEETLSDRILHQIVDDIARAMVNIKKENVTKESNK